MCLSLIHILERTDGRKFSALMREHFVHACGCVCGLEQHALHALPRVPAPALAGDKLVLHPLLVVQAQLADEDLEKVDVLLLEGGALGPLVLCVLEPMLQGDTLLELQDVVLIVEEGDLVHECQRLGHGRGEVGGRHAVDRVCAFIRGLMNRDAIKDALCFPYGHDSIHQ